MFMFFIMPTVVSYLIFVAAYLENASSHRHANASGSRHII
jgi:hypothetical protein